MANTDIRNYSSADRDSLFALYCDVFGSEWPSVDFDTTYHIPGTVLLLAGADQPAGFILFRQLADEGELISIGVAEQSRGSGIGRILLKAAHEWLRHKKAKRWVLEVAADNTPALTLYDRHGFKPMGRRTAYYKRLGQEWCDAITMECPIID